ncbi:hypothetical protein FACS189490_13550 [Clostridia bacterium]|nr:hypothetical protein FACS189490_13550 [Clostridia bacterium]
MKTKTRKVSNKTTIPLERNITLALGEFFGRTLQNKVMDDDGANLTHVHGLGASNLEYIFDNLINNLQRIVRGFAYRCFKVVNCG